MKQKFGARTEPPPSTTTPASLSLREKEADQKLEYAQNMLENAQARKKSAEERLDVLTNAAVGALTRGITDSAKEDLKQAVQDVSLAQKQLKEIREQIQRNTDERKQLASSPNLQEADEKLKKAMRRLD